VAHSIFRVSKKTQWVPHPNGALFATLGWEPRTRTHGVYPKDYKVAQAASLPALAKNASTGHPPLVGAFKNHKQGRVTRLISIYREHQ